MRLLFITVFIFCLVGPARATLGQFANVAKASRTTTYIPVVRIASPKMGSYTINETTLESGTAVLEYASANGVVFAVAWRGPVLPDLSELFGNYFKLFKTETERIRSSGRRSPTMNVEFEGLIVQSSGRMRDFYGHAFVPSLVPSGVVIDDVLR